MANPYYDHTTYPANGAALSSSALRAELEAIEDGFDKLPTLTGNGGKFIKVNAGASALEATDGATAEEIVAATGKTTPADADLLGLVDSAASNVLKKLTWANLKATLKTYFDTLYAAAGSYVTSGGALGTPSSGTLTSCTGLPMTTGVTGVLGAANGGTGVANNAAATLTRSGNHALTLTTTNTTSLTLPTSGTVLSSANGPTLLATLTASNSASLSDTTNLTSTYKSYEFRFVNIVPASETYITFVVSIDGGSNWKTDAAYWQAAFSIVSNSGTPAGAIATTNVEGYIGDAISSVANNGGLNGVLRLFNPAGTGYKQFISDASAHIAGGTARVWRWSGMTQYRGSTSAINAIKFLMGTGNITSGSIEVWGHP